MDGMIAATAWGIKPLRQSQKNWLMSLAKRLALCLPLLLVAIGIIAIAGNSKKQDGRSVDFAEPGSPGGREAWRETGSDSKQGIRDIDKILAQNEAQMGIDYEDGDGLER